jgi:hypothetical protein
MPNYYKKESRNNSLKEKLRFFYQFFKNTIRVLLLILLIHRAFFTKFGGYEDAIKEAKTIREVKEAEQKLYDHEKLKTAHRVKESSPSSIDLEDINAMKIDGKIQESKESEKENILKNLKESEKGITYSKLNLEYEDKEWKERSKNQAFTRDPQRFIFIQPLQLLSEKLGFENNLILDILLKVLVIRLLLN